VDALGEDVLLLAIRENGLIDYPQRVDYALMGAELVGLAASGRVDIADVRIVVLHLALTGDAELDAALQSLIQARRQPTARHWVSRPRRGIREAYLARLTAAGVIRPEQGLLRTKGRITEPVRTGKLLARLEAVTTSSGPLELADVALGGLVHAAGIDRVLYPGWGNRAG
jgi:Golgi phosphoprotein 3 (GPP34)